MSPLEKAFEAVGGQSAMATLIGVTPQAVSRWAITGRVTAERAADIERVTKGAVTRADLRPDLFGALPVSPANPPPADNQQAA